MLHLSPSSSFPAFYLSRKEVLGRELELGAIRKGTKHAATIHLMEYVLWPTQQQCAFAKGKPIAVPHGFKISVGSSTISHGFKIRRRT